MPDMSSVITMDMNRSDGKGELFGVAEPSISFTDFSDYIETVYAQTGLILFMVRIPKGRRMDLRFDINAGPLTFECWLKGRLEYNYAGSDGSQGIDTVTEGFIYAGTAAEEKGYINKPAETEVEMVKLSLDPNLLENVLERVLGKDAAAFSDVLETISDCRNRFMSIPMSASVEAVARSISDCALRPPLRNLALANFANELFYSILSDIYSWTGAKRRNVVQPCEVDTFYRIKSMIDANLNEPLSHSQIARNAGINEFKLKNGFKEVFGTTVNTYLTEQRVKSARKMLETGGVSVNEAAWNVGYTNVSHFIAVFRKHCGVTPGKFLMDIKQKMNCCLKPSV